MLLQNQKRQGRKDGKFRYISGLVHTLAYITKTVFCTLNNKKGESLRKKCWNDIFQLKSFKK